MEGANCMGAYLSGTVDDQPVSQSELTSKWVLVFLAEGFEDAEAACAFDVLGYTHYRPSIASVTVEITGLHERVHGAFGSSYDVDVPIDAVDARRYDALVVPGGFHNLGFDEAYDERLRQIVRALRSRGCPVATMCVGVLPVAEAGVLSQGRATTYALSSRHDNQARLRELGCSVVDEPFVEWDGILSCSGPAYSEQVMARLLELLVGPKAASEVARFRQGLR